MLVYELSLQICPSVPLPFEQASEEIGRFIDSALGKNKQALAYHVSLEFKLYTFDLPHPLESGNIYQGRNIYTVRIRTIRQELASFFHEKLPMHSTSRIQGLGGVLRVIPQYDLDRVFSLTPVVVKTRQGYWRGRMPLAEYAGQLQANLIRKYNYYSSAHLEEDYPLFRKLEFQNHKPVRIPYKNIALLGDKISLTAVTAPQAQEVLYMALGTGVGENNARGCGFLSYRYLKGRGKREEAGLGYRLPDRRERVWVRE